MTTPIPTSGIATVTRVLKSKSMDGTIRRSVELNMGSENDPMTAMIGTELLRKTSGGDRAWQSFPDVGMGTGSVLGHRMASDSCSFVLSDPGSSTVVSQERPDET